MNEPSLRPRRCVTLFDVLTLLSTLIAAIMAADFFSRDGLGAGLLAFVAVLAGAYFVFGFLTFAFVVWLWNHCPFWRVRHDAACYLLGALKNPEIIAKQIDREFGYDDVSQRGD